jgi:hypothetical protein
MPPVTLPRDGTSSTQEDLKEWGSPVEESEVYRIEDLEEFVSSDFSSLFQVKEANPEYSQLLHRARLKRDSEAALLDEGVRSPKRLRSDKVGIEIPRLTPSDGRVAPAVTEPQVMVEDKDLDLEPLYHVIPQVLSHGPICVEQMTDIVFYPAPCPFLSPAQETSKGICQGIRQNHPHSHLPSCTDICTVSLRSQRLAYPCPRKASLGGLHIRCRSYSFAADSNRAWPHHKRQSNHMVSRRIAEVLEVHPFVTEQWENRSHWDIVPRCPALYGAYRILVFILHTIWCRGADRSARHCSKYCFIWEWTLHSWS